MHFASLGADSFYFLQSTMVKNQMEKNEIARMKRDELISQQQRRQMMEEREMRRRARENDNSDFDQAFFR
tara:strand:- start:27 stop:236 length:210 start_codon:yes stop_codon:yes gene_type:complete